MTIDSRVKPALLALAASTLVGLALKEGYTDGAVIPVMSERASLN